MKSTATKQSPGKRSLKTKSDAAQGLRDLFEDELKDIYWAEKALLKAIPKMIKNATSDELVMALENHLEVTTTHVEKCEQAFEMMNKPAMDGLIREAQDIMESTAEGVVRDAGIISAAQKIEHYEIASYGTLCAFAKTLGESEIADLLEQTLNEEKEADQTLTGIAESTINMGAAEGDEEE